MKKLISSITKLTAVAASVLVLSTSAFAASLKNDVVVYNELVTIGDLFRDAGEVANVALFRAPDLGDNGKISAGRVIEAAYTAGLRDITEPDFTYVHVERPSLQFQQGDIAMLLKAEWQKLTFESKADVEIRFQSGPKTLHADPRVDRPLKVTDFQLLPGTSRFNASLSVKTPEGTETHRLRGNVIEMVTVPVLTSNMNRGDLLQASDFEERRLPLSQMDGKEMVNPTSLMGLEAKRNLRSGALVRSNDFAKPMLVARNDVVTLMYKIPGLMLSTQGKVLGNGTANEAVSVLNLTSNRVVQGVIKGRGLVVVEQSGPQARGATLAQRLARADQKKLSQ